MVACEAEHREHHVDHLRTVRVVRLHSTARLGLAFAFVCVCVFFFFFFFFFCLFLPPALSFCFCLLLLLLQTYECSEAAKHVVTAEVPVGETAALHLPSALGGVVTPTTPVAPVYDMARGELDGVDTTVVSLPGGFHSFTVHQ